MKGLSSTVYLEKAAAGETTLDYADFCLLMPHEVIRCEMLTFSRILPFLDNVETYPWKAKAVSDWILHFFMPAIKDHHDFEEHLLFPFYHEKGVPVPDHIVSDHKLLIESLGKLGQIAKDIGSAAEAKNMDEIKRQRTTLEKEWKFMENLMHGHLSEEENYWPSHIRRFGEEEYKKVTLKHHKEKMAQGSDIFVMWGVAVFITAGMEIGHIKPSSGWAPPELLNKLKTSMPWFVLALLGPGWVRKYERYRIPLIACAGDEQPVIENSMLDYMPSCVVM